MHEYCTLYNVYETQTNTRYSMLTHEIEAPKIQSTSTGYATMEYCEMSPPCSCNVSPGWMRVADLNITNPNEPCPPGLTIQTIDSKRFCSRIGPRCTSVIFPVNGVRYNKVCGKVIG